MADRDKERDRPTLLLVDDDQSNLESYSLGFMHQPYRVLSAGGGARAREILQSDRVDVVLTDLKMPGVDGLEVVRTAMALRHPPVCIVITAFGTIETAVEAMREGAFDYITKPVNLLELRAKVEQAMGLRAIRSVADDSGSPASLSDTDFRFEGVVGESDAMREVIEQTRRAAAARVSVLIEAESGTGKELIARALHFNSPRADKPFVPIHCAAMPESLLESLLFGHEKGAFTGAAEQRIGRFECAHGGTVFLDEVGEIPLGVQVKLLRVLEQREIVRVGGARTIPLDIRLVAATNKCLADEVAAGRFREDLFYRLNVVRIEIPPLRHRRADIPDLVRFFLKVLSRENNRPVPKVSAEAMECLVAYDWPGNIRELRNALEQTIVFSSSPAIEVSDLPIAVRKAAPAVESTPAAEQPAGLLGLDSNASLGDLETRYILYTLEKMDGNRTRAAEKLGISRRTLQRKLKELGHDSPDSDDSDDGASD